MSMKSAGGARPARERGRGKAATWGLVALLSVLASSGCDFDLHLPRIPLEPVRSCTEADQWHISGFIGTDVTSGGEASAIRMIVGQSRELHVVPDGYSFAGCKDAIASVRWISANAAAANLGPGVEVAWLTALSPGETRVQAEVTLTTGTVHVASLSVFHAESRQTVSTIRVFPAGLPLPGRTVVFSGTVRLEAGNAGSRSEAKLPFDVPHAGTLDMVVDWQTPTNRVIAHVCPGLVPEDLGCAPVIDGTHSWGEKPSTGAASVAPGVYSFWIANSGTEAETVRYEAGLTGASR
jgi:hypothetical protein